VPGPLYVGEIQSRGCVIWWSGLHKLPGRRDVPKPGVLSRESPKDRGPGRHRLTSRMSDVVHTPHPTTLSDPIGGYLTLKMFPTDGKSSLFCLPDFGPNISNRPASLPEWFFVLFCFKSYPIGGLKAYAGQKKSQILSSWTKPPFEAPQGLPEWSGPHV
jgi:hypothetical protein